MDNAFYVDTNALRIHLDTIREKQNHARTIIDELNRSRANINPQLYTEFQQVLRYAEDLMRYFRDQEEMILEMCSSYDAANHKIDDMLETAINEAQNLF
jgi:uncharacterized protein YukE